MKNVLQYQKYCLLLYPKTSKMTTMQLNEVQELEMNSLTMEHSFSLQSQEVAEFVCSNSFAETIEADVLSNAKFLFESMDATQFNRGLVLAEMVLLKNAMAECGINDGCFLGMLSQNLGH